MPGPTNPTRPVNRASSADADDHTLQLAWRLCLALAWQRRLHVQPQAGEYRFADAADPQHPELIAAGAGDPHAVARWLPDVGWQVSNAWPAVAGELFELYWPLLGLSAGQRQVSGFLAQGIDGRVAAAGGSARDFADSASLRHRQRLRALSDACLVGAATAVSPDAPLAPDDAPADAVPGEAAAARVILDPAAKLAPDAAILSHGDMPKFLVCGQEYERLAVSRHGKGRVIGVPLNRRRMDLDALLDRLAEHGILVLLVEGGGLTVSRFIESDRLDRLQIATAPVWLGAGREGLQWSSGAPAGAPMTGASASSALAAGAAPHAHRLFRMGRDVLWDFDLRQRAESQPPSHPVRIG